MVTISNAVNNVINRQVLIQECITNGIVSYNKLAESLKPEIEAEIGKKVNQSAIVMALRRNANKLEKKLSLPSFKYSLETIKTNLFYVVLEESPTLLSKIQDLYPIIDFKKGGMLNIIQGNYEVGIVTNQKYKEELLDLLHDEKILDTLDDLVSVSLTYPKDFLHTPGIIYDISRFMAWENINIVDIIITKTELDLIISKKDLTRCYQTLGKYVESRENNTN